MYRLTRLSLKNWYLCTCDDVSFRGSIGIVGPTGSGKSSLLDALQTAISGANHNRIHLNASSEGHSERKVIEYCLGYLVPKKDGGRPLREACETIIALTFSEERPDGSVHHVSAGVVMTAREGDSREVVVTRFIAPGFAVTAKDWKGVDAEGLYVKDWEEISAEMKRACPNLREYRAGAERFVADLLAVMRRGARQPDVKHFLNAFFNALQFKPINDPTRFIREFILERDDLDIARVRTEVARWRELAARAQEIEKKLDALKGVIRGYETWGRAVLERTTQSIRKACAAVERYRLAYAASAKQWLDADKELQHERNVAVRLDEMLARDREDLEKKRATLNESGLQARLTQIRMERELYVSKELAEIEREVKGLREVLRVVSNLKSVRDRVPNSFAPSIAASEATLALIDAEGGLGWLKHNAEDVARHVATLKALAGLPERLQGQIEPLRYEVADLRRRRSDLETALKRAAAGGAAVSAPTLALMRLLEAEGIEAVPLCDVVEVEDQSWQMAVEWLLGRRREALIVDPAHVRQAHEILYSNRNREGLHTCHLVKTTRTKDIDVRVAPNSIASVVRSENPHAMAYLVTHLGNCRMAENEADLERHARAIMRNGKATQALDYVVNRDQGMILLLGRTARQRSAADAAAELEAVKDEIATKNRILALLEQATEIAKGAAAYTIDLPTLAFRYEEVERKANELKARETAVLSATDRELVEEIALLEQAIREREQEIREQQTTIVRLSKKEGALQQQLKSAREDLRRAIREKRAAFCACSSDEVRQLAGLVSLPGGEKFKEPANPFVGKKLELRDKPGEALAYFKTEEETAEQKLRELAPDKLLRHASGARNRLIDNYCRAYAIEYPHVVDDAPYVWDYNWAVLHYERLERNELREHLAAAQKAEREMVTAIKEDLLSRLTDKFAKLDDQLRALNAHLRKHRFTGQVYRFFKKADPAFDKIRRLAMAVAANPDEAEAIIEKRHPDPMLREAMTDLEAYIESSGGAGLEDYRRYFSFDLEMLPEDQADEDAENASGRMSLSARAAVASGGEAQAPFYVAMAASMAMAYFPGGHPSTGPSGMGLVIFDEAFNKLDVRNTQSLIRFFADLGLQLLVAAPETERPVFTEAFDTVVTVSKSEATKTVYIASDFPKERARRELAAINPNHKGVEGFRLELAGRAKDTALGGALADAAE